MPAVPSTPKVASPEEIGEFCCSTLLDGETHWINRRKETVELESESLLRHRLSIDFNIPHALPAASPGDKSTYYAPLVLLRKTPGKFTRFDVVDESGRSLPLPTRARNAEISRRTLITAANRALAGDDPSRQLPSQVAAELRFIATAEFDLAAAFARELYLRPEKHPANEHTDTRKTLMGDADFAWLIGALTQASVVLFKIEGEPGTRRIVKVSFDEEVPDVTRFERTSPEANRLERTPLYAWLPALAYRFGWRGYLVQVYSPFIGARNYHFELHAPPGLEVIESSEAPVAANPQRVHLDRPNVETERSSIFYAQFRVRGHGYVGAAALIAAVIAATLTAARILAPQLTDAATSSPALLLLFPGLAAGYLARPAHPLVTRLLDVARWIVVGSAGLAYLGAARLAVITTGNPASEHSLETWFTVLAIMAWILAAPLVFALLLPLRVSNPLRLRWRRLRGKPGPVRPAE